MIENGTENRSHSGEHADHPVDPDVEVSDTCLTPLADERGVCPGSKSRGRPGGRTRVEGVDRLCGRPGCSDPASVAYGMRPADLVFWLDGLARIDDGSHGVLCRRHADSMVVPRNWTLDDMRDPELHLFRPPDPTDPSPRPRRPPTRRATGEQLELGVDPDAAGDDAGPGSAPSADEGTETAAAEPADPAAGAGGDDAEVESWTPSFDADDDLDGLLAARSPLLARAFGGTDRPRSTQ